MTSSPLKTYSIVYAEEASRFVKHEIQARTDEQAAEFAKSVDWYGLSFDPGCSVVSRHILLIEETETGRSLMEDDPIDDWLVG